MDKAEFGRLQRSFEWYAPLLKVRPFNPVVKGEVMPMVPLRLGNIQTVLNDILVDDIQKTGKIRRLILKARRHQISTYCMARNFWHLHMHPGTAAFCLTHHGDTTNELFSMADGFLQHMLPDMRFAVGADNAKEISHPAISSHIKVGTAGSATIGHGFAINRFHGSEVSRWPNAQEHMTGILQAVPNTLGSEIILESVGGQRGGFWHQMWGSAIRGDSSFQPIFFPWFAHQEYLQADLARWMDERTPEDPEYQKLYKLMDQQMAWRHSKLLEFPADARDVMFRSMYPATPDDAFIRVGGSFIAVELVRAARKATHPALGPKIMGVDLGAGKDRSTRIVRRGRAAYDLQKMNSKNPMELVTWIAKAIDVHQPAMTFVDASGATIGLAVVARLHELGYTKVMGVQFGGAAHDKDRHKNLRVSMWVAMREWLREGAEIPDSEELEADLTAPNELPEDSAGRIRIEAKEDMRSRGMPSPDCGDALALTWAARVNGDNPEEKKETDEMRVHAMAMAKARSQGGTGSMRVPIG